MVTYLEGKREEYKNVIRINPNTIDSVQWFQVAIDLVNIAIFMILNPTEKFSRMSAIEPAQKHFVEELEALKKELEEHPNRKKALENESSRKLMEALKEQDWKIKSDDQFKAWLITMIPDTIKIDNKELFLANVVKRIFETQNFEESDRKYGDYERYKYSGNILAILDLRETTLWAYIIVVKSPFGYEKMNLQLYKIPKVYTLKKDVIVPSVNLSEEYIVSKKVNIEKK